ncbi:DUF4062 domain-containing protein [Paractinoplanes brasiliensis]|uniref:DUF4062 domain-containing protein n=1 Tax=Paractinoplanes brasiliensis TaxID=52695 RepID=A0A4R6J828_9ACTN|nr:DUF4062 domain-containing protein [Actinoplanes brasiliensis]TDO31733.1 hypothetical protein C8E87_7162 [Actinoplanes brasiliensis]GID30674.1 hypothetical protein Abr02nite_56570 [Actinoplanes brasiliensis]
MQSVISGFGEHLGSVLGALVVTVLVAAFNWPFRWLRRKGEKAMAVYLGATPDELSRHREAVVARLGKDPVTLVEDPGPDARAKAIRDANVFVGLYGLEYGPREDGGKSAGHREFELAAARPGGRSLRLWQVDEVQAWLRVPPTPEPALLHELTAEVKEHTPKSMPLEPRDLAQQVAAAVREVRRAQVPESRYLDSLLEPRSFVLGALVAVGASLYFTIRIAATGAPASFTTVLLLSLACGVVAYLVRAGASIAFLR